MKKHPINSTTKEIAEELAKNIRQLKPHRKLKKVKTRAVAVLTLRKEKGMKGACATKMDKELKHNKQYEYLHVDKTKMTRSGKEREFFVTCKCGNHKYMTSRKIFSRYEERAGCMGTSCRFSKIEMKVWHNPEFAVWFQYHQILSKTPEDLDNEWGGFLMQEVETPEEDEGYRNFLKFINKLIIVDKGKWWIHQINPLGGYREDNVKIKSNPDPKLFKTGEVYVRLADSLVTVAELAESLNLPYNRAVDIRGQMSTDEEFVETLINEATNGR